MDENASRNPEETLRCQAGLCGSCFHMRVIVSGKGSFFAQCGRALNDPAYVKYPRLPVLSCAGWESLAPESPKR